MYDFMQNIGYDKERIGRLIVVPSDPLDAYVRQGMGNLLKDYYNPGKLFNEVFALSPLESGVRREFGMTIIGVTPGGFIDEIRRLKPDLIRGYGGHWAADLVCSHRLRHVPVIVSLHDTDASYLRPSIAYADIVICMSQVVADRAISVGVAPSRIRILPNRVDRTVFRPTEDGEFRRAFHEQFPVQKKIVHVGRKSEQKNLETVIKSLEFLPDNYGCIFIGRGEAESYKELASQLHVASRCFWVDAVPNADLAKWYSACDCMCTPSLYEGFGIVFIEAAACGSVIITSDIAPMNEYLKDGESAILVKDFRSPHALASAIQSACENDRIREMLRRGARVASEPFSKPLVEAREAAIYREAVALDDLVSDHPLALLPLKGRLLSQKYIHSAALGKIKKFVRGS